MARFRHQNLLMEVQTQILSGAKTLNNAHAQVQALNPGGAGRSVYLPTAASTNSGQTLTVANTHTTISTSNFLAVNSESTLYPGDSISYVSDGSNWIRSGLATRSMRVGRADVSSAKRVRLSLVRFRFGVYVLPF